MNDISSFCESIKDMFKFSLRMSRKPHHFLRYALLRYALWVGSLACVYSTFTDTVVFAQPADGAFTHVVRDVIVTPPNRMEFDIIVKNSSSDRLLWANGTFAVRLSNVNLRGATITLDSTALPTEDPFATPPLTRRVGYSFQSRINADRNECLIAVIGPDNTQNARTLNAQDSVLVARVRLVVTQGLSMPDSVRVVWSEPLQNSTNPSSLAAIVRHTSAAKSERTFGTPRGTVIAANDNTDLLPRFETSRVETFQAPQATLLAPFTAEYLGDKRNRLRWTATIAVSGIRPADLNAGFIVRRGVRPLGDVDDSNVRFTDTVASFTRQADLRVSRAVPRAEFVLSDSTPNRNETYIYELSFRDLSRASAGSPSGLLVVLGTASATSRNAFISAAQAAPNPASGAMAIVYSVEDRARVSAALFDVEGRRILDLFTDEEQPRGEYRRTFDVTNIPSGFVNVVLRATPVNDASIKASQAVIKLQVIK